ncbi:hypothetical protein [Nocardia grenadensis]|uniref:hypothetical protein n=1 Tax=Nocardia grenadensis TaxID=931537 RepID=UPI0007A3DD78|nr:hypothetical protein [Nocardia grenadensis]
MTDHEPGATPNDSLPAPGGQPVAIGYLRTDLCGHRGFVTARLRLAAIAHGYRLRWLVELPADPRPDHLTTLRAALDRTGADAVIVAATTHLPGRQLHALRTITPVIADTTVLPRTSEFRARLRALLGRYLLRKHGRSRRDADCAPNELPSTRGCRW